MEKMKISLSRKSGVPAAWERGGGLTHTGSAQIVCAPHGGRMKPLYLRRSGHRACAEHALFPVGVGCLIIRAGHHRGEFSVKIFRIEDLDYEMDSHHPSWWGSDLTMAWRCFAMVKLVNSFDHGEWDHRLEPELEAAVCAARKKATTYHCRQPIWLDREAVYRPLLPDHIRRRRLRLRTEMEQAQEAASC